MASKWRQSFGRTIGRSQKKSGRCSEIQRPATAQISTGRGRLPHAVASVTLTHTAKVGQNAANARLNTVVTSLRSCRTTTLMDWLAAGKHLSGSGRNSAKRRDLPRLDKEIIHLKSVCWCLIVVVVQPSFLLACTYGTDPQTQSQSKCTGKCNKPGIVRGFEMHGR